MLYRLVVMVLASGLTAGLAAQESTLGRLFSTPEQRAGLDRARNALFDEQLIEELLSEDVFPELVEPAYEQQSVMQFGGMVRQSDGSHTLWLNGIPVLESDLPPNARLDVSGVVAVLYLRIAGTEYPLKPGQTLDAAAGVVREAYEVSPEQVLAINAEVAERAERMRALARRSAQRQTAASADPGEPDAAAQIPSEEEALVQSVLEGLRLMQQLQEVQP